MRTVIIIPARYASSRYPGKPLVPLRDSSGEFKPLIHRSWEAATKVVDEADVFVATDDLRISECCTGFGAQVIMTSGSCRNGTERCAEAVLNAGIVADVIVNFQGDAPLTPPWFVQALVEVFETDPDVEVATPVLRCNKEAFDELISDRRAGRVGATTAVFDARGNALYFSKEVIPYIGIVSADRDTVDVYHHVGVYAYRLSALQLYQRAPEGILEKLEGLEQIRFLDQGISVRCVEVDARGSKFWELNNPVDVARIEAVL